MKTREITVTGRSIASNGDTALVRTSIGVDELHVLFDSDEWLDFPITVSFQNSGDADSALVSTSLTLAALTDSEWAAEATCTIPWEVIEDIGTIAVTLQGTDSSGNHIVTAYGAPLTVIEAGDVSDGTVPESAPTQSEWEQAYADAMAAANDAASAAARVEAILASTSGSTLEDILESLGDAMRYKGAVDTTDDLPESPTIGDAYIVASTKLYVYDGENWVMLADNYELPAATDSTLGGVIVGDGMTIDSGTLSIGDLTHSGSGSEIPTDGCALFGASGEGWSEQETTTGKNLLDMSGLSKTESNGITFTPVYADNGSLLYVSASGTSTGRAQMKKNSAITLDAGTYTFSSGFGTYSSGLTAFLTYIADGTTVYVDISASTEVSFTLTEAKSIDAVLDIRYSDVTVSDARYRPQIELGSTATAYEPYTGGAPSPSPDYPQEVVSCTGTDGYIHLYVYESDGETLSSTVAIPLPTKGYAAALPDGTADGFTVDSAGHVVWTDAIGYTTTAATDGITATVGTDAMSSTGEIADGADVYYALSTPATESRGYVEMPELPDGAILRCPELDSIGAEWWITGAQAAAEHAISNSKAHVEQESRIEALEAAVAALATA